MGLGTINSRILAPAHALLARLHASNVGSRLTLGALWSLVGALVSRFSTLISAICMAKLLGGVGFGELGTVQATVGMLGLVAGFGLGQTSTKYVAEFRNSEPRRAGQIMTLTSLIAMVTGVLMASALVLYAPWLAAHTLSAPHLAGLLQISAILLLFSVLNGAQIGALAGLEAFPLIARINVLTGALYFPLTVGGSYWFGTQGAVWGLAIAQVLAWICYHIVLRLQLSKLAIPFHFRDCHREWRVIFDFSLPALLANVMAGAANWAATALLVNQANGYLSMGIYNAANQWRLIIMFIPSMIMQAALPVMSSLSQGSEQKADFDRSLTFAQMTMIAVGFPVAIGFMFFSDIILGFYGADFQGGSIVFIGLVLTALIQCIGSITGTMIEAKGMMWYGFWINAGWALLYLGMVALTVGHWHGVALAFASVAAYCVITLVSYYLMRRMLPAGMVATVVKSLLAALAVAGICLVTPVPLRPFVAIPMAGVALLLLLRYLKRLGLLRPALTS
ncbi:colanic acid exporter [compost metagenome]